MLHNFCLTLGLIFGRLYYHMNFPHNIIPPPTLSPMNLAIVGDSPSTTTIASPSPSLTACHLLLSCNPTLLTPSPCKRTKFTPSQTSMIPWTTFDEYYNFPSFLHYGCCHAFLLRHQRWLLRLNDGEPFLITSSWLTIAMTSLLHVSLSSLSISLRFPSMFVFFSLANIFGPRVKIKSNNHRNRKPRFGQGSDSKSVRL
ncbi:hypothetical protein AAZV13_01G028850 [Glycine max]